jgi:intein-encoded DNA endonuclease-like protein
MLLQRALLQGDLTKQRLNPEICYLIGLCDRRKDSLYVSSNEDAVIERFAKILVEEFGIAPGKISVSAHGKETIAYTYNSKAMKFIKDVLKRRHEVFKYANDYSANYFAGLFDSRGYVSEKGFEFRSIDLADQMVLENLNFHIKRHGSAQAIAEAGAFRAFIKNYSIRMKAASAAKA